MTDVIDTISARKNLGANVVRILQERLRQGLPHSRYWLAKQLGVTGARIKLICDGAHDPAWSFVLNLREVLSGDGFRQITESELYDSPRKYRHVS